MQIFALDSKQILMRIFCLLLFYTCLAVAQSTNATLSGTVNDSTDALVPSAKVSVRHTKTGVQNRTESNAAGVYLFASLPPGHAAIERTARD